MEYLSLFLVLVGYGCYKLGVGGSLVWLALCGVAFRWVKEANAGGGCDGGLCILPYVFILPPAWLGLWLVVWLCRRTIQKSEAGAAASIAVESPDAPNQSLSDLLPKD